MIKAVGIDSVEIERMNAFRSFSLKRLERIFSQDELAYALSVSLKINERLAVRFAAKEAFFKAMSQLFPEHGVPFLTVCRYVSVAKSKNQPPYLSIYWNALGKISLSYSTIESRVSFTHTKSVATVIVILC